MGEEGAHGTAGRTNRFAEAEVWSTTVQGHRIEGRFGGGITEKTAWLLVDGTTLGRVSGDGTLRISAPTGRLTKAGWPGAQRAALGMAGGVTLEVRHSRGSAYDMELVFGSEGERRSILLTAPEGSRGARFQAAREKHPRLAVLRHLPARLGYLLVPLMVLLVEPVLALLRRLLEMLRIPLPRVPMPDLPSVDLPTIPWPDLPDLPRIPWPDLPDLPRIPWPDLPGLPGWLDWLRPVVAFVAEHNKLLAALAAGLGLAVLELRRQRTRESTLQATRSAELSRLAAALRTLSERGQQASGAAGLRGADGSGDLTGSASYSGYDCDDDQGGQPTP